MQEKIPMDKSRDIDDSVVVRYCDKHKGIRIHVGNNEAEFMTYISPEGCEKLYELLGEILEKQS